MTTPHLTHVLPQAAAAVGLPIPGLPEMGNSLGLPGAKRAVVVLIDGMGYHQVLSRAGHAPFLRPRLRASAPIRTVSPSTTAAAVTALGTGCEPGRTAMAGYSLRDPATGEPFNLISWNSPVQRAETWQTEPTIGERLAATGQTLAVVQPPEFVGSGLTNAAWRGTVPYSASSFEARIDATIQALTSHRLVYLYWGELDHTGHGHGWGSEKWIAELESVDSHLQALARALPSETLLLITADHGMVDITERIDVAAVPELSSGVDLVAGEERACQVYTREPEEVAARWRDLLGGKARILTKQEWIDTGLLGGTVSEHTASVIGDVIAFPQGTLGIGDSRFMSPGALSLIGVHGSLTDEEMDVPLVIEVA